ncbi:mRNA 3' end processing factor [Cryptotrichosporon argae]
MQYYGAYGSAYPAHAHAGPGPALAGPPALPVPAAYPPPPPPAAGLPFPPPPPHPDAFRPWFADCLRQLTFNSRPMIQALSGEAMRQRDVGDMRAMSGVVEEIEAACLRAPPQYKLPLLYLIDSISKNVGQPYTDRLLPAILTRLYPRVYRDVDGVTRVKIEEMLKLWRTGGPYGIELYPAGVREAVERAIFGDPQPAQLAQPAVLAALQDTLRDKQEQMAMEFTTAVAKQVNVLVQIEKLLKAGPLSAQELADIMDKVQAIRQPRPPAPARAHPHPHSQPVPPLAQPNPAYPPFLAPRPQFPPGFPGGSTRLAAHAPATPPVPAPSAAPALPLNVADILRNLNTTGLLSQPRTPDLPAKPTSGTEYEDMILNLGIELGAFDLNRLAVPVAQFGARCKQCGLRFLNADAKLQAHMDWHFRRNRNERQSEGRGAHMRWLPTAAEWVVPDPQPEVGPSSPRRQAAAASAAAPAAGAATASAPASKLTAERLAALSKKWVRAPDAASTRPCPVCKEAFKPEWSEAHEEWVFNNAIDVHGTIYHATCRAEQMAAAVAAKLAAADRRSVSKSPSAAPVGLPNIDVGAKRKAENAEGDAKRLRVGAGDGAELGASAGARQEQEQQQAVEPARPEDVKMEVVESAA